MKHLITFLFFILTTFQILSQSLMDDFEGNGNIATWAGNDCGIVLDLQNPFKKGINTSSTVLEYRDGGGLFANIHFDKAENFLLLDNSTFSFKIYIPSSSLTGNAPNQVSLKLQNRDLDSPWLSQVSIEKPLKVDEWQTVSFDFSEDVNINFDPNSRRSIERLDLNRVLIQINGENNTDQVTAYLDDFEYQDHGLPLSPFSKLVWSDEFDKEGPINPEKWHHQTIFPNGNSWYNNEIQHYTDRTDNSFVENGNLIIKAKKEPFTDQGVTKQYTSARLNSKYAFTYGRVEIRAKLPKGIGTWPALWMLGQNISERGAYWQTQGYGDTPWPDCGEIDIMEHWGDNQNWVTSATHTPSSHGNTINVGGQWLETASDEFHDYSLEWTEEYLVFSVDEKPHLILSPKEKNAANWPYVQNQYLVLNVAIQPHIDPLFTDSALEVDYIRIYQETSTSFEDKEIKDGFQLYPNPVGDALHINISNPLIEPLAISILDLAGNRILRKQPAISWNNTRIPLSTSIPPGIYFLELEGKNTKLQQKFVKM